MTHSWYLNAWGPWGFFGFGAVGILVAVLVIIVLIALKGYALWTAAKRDEKWWFIVMLVINTIGILEIIYLLAVAKKWPKNMPASHPSGTPPQA